MSSIKPPQVPNPEQYLLSNPNGTWEEYVHFVNSVGAEVATNSIWAPVVKERVKKQVAKARTSKAAFIQLALTHSRERSAFLGSQVSLSKTLESLVDDWKTRPAGPITEDENIFDSSRPAKRKTSFFDEDYAEISDAGEENWADVTDDHEERSGRQGTPPASIITLPALFSTPDRPNAPQTGTDSSDSSPIEAGMIIANVEQVTLNGIDLTQLLRKYQRRVLKEGRPVKYEDTESFLAVQGCIHLSETRPVAYNGLINDTQWIQLRNFFQERMLEPKEWQSILPMAEEMRCRKQQGKPWFPQGINQDDASSCALATCMSSLYTSLTYASPPEKDQESTWTIDRVVPLLKLINDNDLKLKYDTRTDHTTKRPDVQIVLSRAACVSQRVVSNIEIKTPWAPATERKKDCARVITSVIRSIASDCETFSIDANQPKLAVWLNGHHSGIIYEVFLLNGMFVAVEIGPMVIPTSLKMGEEITLARSIAYMLPFRKRVLRIKKTMLTYKKRSVAVQKSHLLVSTPVCKKTRLFE
ncbi:hypothetical protein BC832DRAFT_596372 [Gaertneriomyces semiglobifer]|nr:hypothetical protein BC832DRAFT_596372 [Gaertneriomyces semiglobifer]